MKLFQIQVFAIPSRFPTTQYFLIQVPSGLTILEFICLNKSVLGLGFIFNESSVNDKKPAHGKIANNNKRKIGSL